MGNGDHKKIHQNSPPFFNAKSSGKVKRKKKIAKVIWRAGKLKF